MSRPPASQIGRLPGPKSQEVDFSSLGRRAIKLFTRLSGVLIFSLYSIGWMFVSLIYGALRVDPSWVGIDLQWILVRAISAAIVLAIVSLILVAIPVLTSVDDEVTVAVWLVSAGSIIVVGADVSILTFKQAGIFLIFFLGLIGTFGLGMLAWLLSRIYTRVFAQQLTRKSLTLGSVVAIFCLGCCLLPWLGARQIIREIRDGRSVAVGFGIGLDVISFDRVRVKSSSTSVDTYSGKCLTLIGSGDGIYYLYDAQLNVTVQAPIQFVTLTSGIDC